TGYGEGRGEGRRHRGRLAAARRTFPQAQTRGEAPSPGICAKSAQIPTSPRKPGEVRRLGCRAYVSAYGGDPCGRPTWGLLVLLTDRGDAARRALIRVLIVHHIDRQTGATTRVALHHPEWLCHHDRRKGHGWTRETGTMESRKRCLIPPGCRTP